MYDEALALFLQYFDKLRHFFRVGDAKQLVHRVKLHKQAVQNGQVARALVQYPLCDALEGLVSPGRRPRVHGKSGSLSNEAPLREPL